MMIAKTKPGKKISLKQSTGGSARPVSKGSSKSLDYHVIASGSSGNAVRIGSIMVDCGTTYAATRDDLYKVDTLLITHSHGDHIHAPTFNRIRKEFPRIKVYANAYTAYQYDVDVVIGTAPVKLPKKRTVIPFDGRHDIPVTYFIIQMDGLNIFYATDTSYVENPLNLPLDYVFLESNYDERKLREMAKQYRRKGYDPAVSNLRHLSTQKCKEFYYVNRRNKDSELIELHKSSRFY